MKVIKNGQSLIVVLDDGTVLQNNNCDDKLFNLVVNAESDVEVAKLMIPAIGNKVAEKAAIEEIFDKVRNSDLLERRGNSIYWPSVSQLSMPKTLVEKVLEAEENEDEDKLEAYKNFWTLLSLNPDSRCRENLFWYLDTWGMKISKAGLFIGYRNVDIKKQSNNHFYSQELCDFVVQEYERIRNMKKGTGHYYVHPISRPGGVTPEFELLKDDFRKEITETYVDEETGEETTEVVEVITFEELINDESQVLWNLKNLYEEFKAVNFIAANLGSDTIFTDHHSHKFEIKIGEMVTMPREQCDSVQENQCSRGLHLANAEWLNEGYFGTQGLVCLCNPADVVAVPYDSSYGKLRTCAYLPIALTQYKDGKVVPYNVEDGFESKWIKTVLYDGVTSTEQSAQYVLAIPDIPEINKSIVTNSIIEIARKYMK